MVNPLVMLVAIGCASTPTVPERWGVLSSAGDTPVVHSLVELRPGERFRAHRIGRLTEAIEVTIADSSRSEGSPLFGPDGGNTGWKHGVAEPAKVPRGAIWVCVPADWSVRVTAANEAAVEAHGEKGSLTSATAAEGVQIRLDVRSRRQSLYFYLGYDVSAPQTER